jgi:uncharacterized protein (TIGR03663 family)
MAGDHDKNPDSPSRVGTVTLRLLPRQGRGNWLQTNYLLTTPPSKIRWAIFIVIALLALAARLPQLGTRPMHTDEAVNAYITGEVLAGETWRYDPQDRHGPVLYLLAKPVARLAGAQTFSDLTEADLRLTPVILSCATILLLGAAVELFGFLPCLVAALLFAFAPLPFYYSRYFIHETLFVAATLGLMLAGWRALKTGSSSAAALAGLCAALMLATKETAVIHFFALAVAGLVAWLRSPDKKIPAPKILLTAGLVFVAAVILLFTWGGLHWRALADLWHAVPHFAARAGGEGHGKPFGYYAALLAGGWSGIALLLLAIAGLFYAVQKRQPGFSFLAVYALLIFGVYSAIPYKTPWLALNLWLPLALLAGLALEWLRSASIPFSGRRLIWILIGALGVLIGHDTGQRVFRQPADEKNPYAYAHTGEDLLRLPARLEQLAKEGNLTEPRIAVIATDAWPLPWYLRKFSRVGYWQPGQEPGPADFYLTTTELSSPPAEHPENFRPEFFGVRPNVLLILWAPYHEPTLTRPSATLSHPMGEGWGEGPLATP